MPAAFIPFLAKLLLTGLNYFIKKAADKSALQKKITQKLSEMENRTRDSADIRRDYQSAQDELNAPVVEETKK